MGLEKKHKNKEVISISQRSDALLTYFKKVASSIHSTISGDKGLIYTGTLKSNAGNLSKGSLSNRPTTYYHKK